MNLDSFLQYVEEVSLPNFVRQIGESMPKKDEQKSRRFQELVSSGMTKPEAWRAAVWESAKQRLEKVDTNG